jgi:hypothetical protein
MKNLHLLSLICITFIFLGLLPVYGNKKGLPLPPSLPANIPPPPNFSNASSKIGRYQIVSAEYYSQDPKPFLYKRLIKIDTTTGESWVLHSVIGIKGEKRAWLPLEQK